MERFKRIIKNAFHEPELYYRRGKVIASNHLPDVFSFSPVHISIVPTHRCNLKCKMCDVGQGLESSSMVRQLKGLSSNAPLSISDWNKFIGSVASFKPRISLAGGEPLLSKEILELSKFITSKRLGYGITTNGTLLDKYAEDFVSLGVDGITVSLDGPSEVHDFIRGVPGMFQKTMDGIGKLNDAKSRLRQSNPILTINCAISDHNYMYLEEAVHAFKDARADFIRFTHLYFRTDAMVEQHNILYGETFYISPSSHAVNPSQVDTNCLIRQIENVKSHFNAMPIYFRPELKPEEIQIWYKKPQIFLKGHDKCHALHSCLVASNGDVVAPASLCVNVLFGNIKESKLTDIVNNQKYRRFRKKIRTKLFPICSRCCGII